MNSLKDIFQETNIISATQNHEGRAEANAAFLEQAQSTFGAPYAGRD